MSEQETMNTEEPQAETGGEQSGHEATDQQHATGDDLIEALTELGHKFTDVMRIAWNSEQRKQIEADVRSGVNSLANSLEESFRKVSTSKEGQEFLGKAEDVAETVTDSVRKSEIVQNLADGLMLGLKALGDSIENLSTEIQSRNAARKNAAPGPDTTADADDAASDAGQNDSQEIPIARA